MKASLKQPSIPCKTFKLQKLKKCSSVNEPSLVLKRNADSHQPKKELDSQLMPTKCPKDEIYCRFEKLKNNPTSHHTQPPLSQFTPLTKSCSHCYLNCPAIPLPPPWSVSIFPALIKRVNQLSCRALHTLFISHWTFNSAHIIHHLWPKRQHIFIYLCIFIYIYISIALLLFQISHYFVLPHLKQTLKIWIAQIWRFCLHLIFP